MKYILLNYQGDVEKVFFNKNNRDNCSEPYIKLKKKLKDLGYLLEDSKDHKIEDCEYIIFWNARNLVLPGNLRTHIHFLKSIIKNERFKNVFQEAVKKRLYDKMVLVLTEPASVISQNYNISLHKYFKYIFTWDKNLVDNIKYFRFYLPNTSIFPDVDKIPFHERKMLVDISSNKFSTHERELYTERRNTIKFFEKYYPNDFDLYGMGWNVKQKKSIKNLFKNISIDKHYYTSYRGTVEHKWDLLPKYKFTICYENIYNQPDYISNRIFDVLRCKSVPIYWGAPNIDDYVDKDAFINRENFSSNEELGYFLSNITENEYEKFIEAGRDYLNSEKFKLFLSDNFVNTIINVLNLEKG